MTFTSKARKATIATLAALAVITAVATIAPSQAQAGNHFGGALIGGATIGGLIGAAAQNRYAPVYRTCHTQWETRYNSYGRPYSVQVQYC